MTQVRLTFCLILMFSLVGCDRGSKNRLGSSQIGKSKGELVSEMGAPLSEETLTEVTPGEKVELILYASDRAYQLEHNRVVAFHREPLEKEKKVQYWFQLPNAKRREISQPRSFDRKYTLDHRHLVVVHFLDLPYSVLYDANSGTVLRVMEHE